MCTEQFQRQQIQRKNVSNHGRGQHTLLRYTEAEYNIHTSGHMRTPVDHEMTVVLYARQMAFVLQVRHNSGTYDLQPASSYMRMLGENRDI